MKTQRDTGTNQVITKAGIRVVLATSQELSGNENQKAARDKEGFFPSEGAGALPAF